MLVGQTKTSFSYIALNFNFCVLVDDFLGGYCAHCCDEIAGEETGTDIHETTDQMIQMIQMIQMMIGKKHERRSQNYVRFISDKKIFQNRKAVQTHSSNRTIIFQA